jgi:hypothetical protein
MKKTLEKLINGSICLAMASVVLVSCKKENQNDLPGTSPDAYNGKIDGFDSSEQIYRNNLVAYWSFDDTKNEILSGTAATSSSNDSYVAGVRGKALNLNGGWVYYATQFNAFKTANLKSWTVSEWVNVLNNGSKQTMAFQLARPGNLNGNINTILLTNQYPAADLDNFIIKAVFADGNGNGQDNLNAWWLSTYKSPKTGPNKWIHVVTTYDAVANNIQIWADGIMVGTTDYQNRGSNYFKSWEPSEVIIGGWYNHIPGKEVNGDTGTQPLQGKVDEIRVYNTVLGAAHIRALYNLGVAGK